MVHVCACKFVVFHVDAQSLLGIVNRGSPKRLNTLARELFWFGLEHHITLLVEWVPREENTLADELSKLLILDDFMLNRTFFRRVKESWGPHSVDMFASNANNLCERFYSLHWCTSLNIYSDIVCIYATLYRFSIISHYPSTYALERHYEN